MLGFRSQSAARNVHEPSDAPEEKAAYRYKGGQQDYAQLFEWNLSLKVEENPENGDVAGQRPGPIEWAKQPLFLVFPCRSRGKRHWPNPSIRKS